MHRHWFEYIVPRSTWLASLAAIVVWLVLAGMFGYLLGAFVPSNDSDTNSALGTPLFFATFSVFGVCAGAWVMRKSALLIDDIELSCSAQERRRVQADIAGLSTRRALMVAIGAVLAGLGHSMLLRGSVIDFFEPVLASPIVIAGVVGTMLSWFVITHIVLAFIRNAEIFARVGAEYVKVDLIQRENHNKIGRACNHADSGSNRYSSPLSAFVDWWRGQYGGHHSWVCGDPGGIGLFV